LPPGKGAYQDSEPFDLHVMHKKLEEEGVEKEKIKQVCCLTFRKIVVLSQLKSFIKSSLRCSKTGMTQ
jgi:hypothetical protein